MEAILKTIKKQKIPIKPSVVISNKPNARGLRIAAKLGVYAVKVKINNSRKSYKGIANLGYRPTFNQKKILLEVNIFNFSGNLYNKKLSVEFLKFIRGEKKFIGVDDLRSQIKKDLLIAKKVK